MNLLYQFFLQVFIQLGFLAFGFLIMLHILHV